jgi:glycosyltransferase involved in cell wall biosynthesis
VDSGEEMKASPIATPRPRKSAPRVSVVVPVFNEEEAVGLFMAALDAALPPHAFNLQILFINDGSRDGTLAALTALAAHDPRLVVVNLSRNFGKEAAMTAGLAYADGDVVIPMDVDLQDPPGAIPAMLDKWREGYDVVLGMRSARTSDGAVKRVSASWFYHIFNALSPMKIPVNVGDFRLMDREVIEALSGLGERNRFMKGLFAWTGFPTATVEYVRAERAAGVTKWNYWKLWNFALDGIFSFSTAPLRIWTYLGLLVAVGAAAYAAYIFIRTMLTGVDVPGYASLLIVVLILGAIQLVSIGVIGEYVGRLFIETKQRPLYVVRGVYSSDKAARPARTKRTRPA